MKWRGSGVAVFCGSNIGGHPLYRDIAVQLGRGIAQRGAVLVYGGGSIGLMGVVADAALAAGGTVVGVIPRMLARAELAHAGVSEMIVVETMHERKALMSARCAAYVVLPGGYGTCDEFIEILTWRQLDIHDKPIVLLNAAGFFDAMLAQFHHAVKEGFIRRECLGLFTIANTAAEVFAVLSDEPASSHVDGDWQ